MNALRANRPVRLRNAPSLQDTQALLRTVRNVSGYPTNLIVRLLYGCGLRVPVTTLKHAKRQGCAAFRGSRVYLAQFLRWFFESPDRSAINYDQQRAQHVLLQNAKLKVELRQLKRELIPADEVARVGAELGSAIRKVVTRLHRTAPSLEGQPVATIEARLKDEQDDILKQMHTLHEQLKTWQGAE